MLVKDIMTEYLTKEPMKYFDVEYIKIANLLGVLNIMNNTNKGKESDK